jgi:hypothetical protein
MSSAHRRLYALFNRYMALQNNLRTHQIAMKKTYCCLWHSTAQKSFNEDTNSKESCYKKKWTMFANHTGKIKEPLYIYVENWIKDVIIVK